MPNDHSSFSEYDQSVALSEVQNLKIFPQKFEIIQAIRIISHAQPSFMGGRHIFQAVQNEQIHPSLKRIIKFKWSLKTSEVIHYLEKAEYKDCWELRLNYLNVLTIHGPMVMPSSMYHLNAHAKATTEQFLGIFATSIFNTYYKIACKYWLGLDDLLPHNSNWSKTASSLLSYLNHPSYRHANSSVATLDINKADKTLEHPENFYSLSAMLGLTLKKKYSTWDIYQIFAQQYKLKIHIKELTGRYYQVSKSIRMQLASSSQTNLDSNNNSSILGSCVLGEKTWIQNDSIIFTVQSNSHSFVKEFWQKDLYHKRFCSLLRYLIPSHINYKLHAKSAP